MASLCSLTNSCTPTNVVSLGTIIGIVVGCLTSLAAIIAAIVIICMLFGKKKRQPVVWVQSPAYQAAGGYNQPMDMNYYSPYGQPSGMNIPPPAYQQGNMSVISGENTNLKYN